MTGRSKYAPKIEVFQGGNRMSRVEPDNDTPPLAGWYTDTRNPEAML